MTTPVLHPRIAEVVTILCDAQQEMLTLIDGLASELAERMPAANAWSVAQIVEHLAIVEDGTGRLVSKLLKQVEGTTDLETGPVIADAFRLKVEDARAHPIVAPDFVTPRGALTFTQALERQATARERLLAALSAASGRTLGAVSAPHPVLGDLNGYQWAAFPALHQRRHLHQIRHTLAQLAA